jgi:hypothetical protein
VNRDGTATVSHEVVLKVRGGPFKGFSIDGVDEDADLSPDARVARLSGKGSEWPLLVHKSDDGELTLEIDDKKGVRAGVYRFQLSYRTDLVGRDLLQQRGASVLLSWAGPRLADGIDSVKATFSIPRGDSPPGLPERGEGETAEDVADLLVSQLRRGADKDELELVRAHVAKGEPALWSLRASASSFDAFSMPVQTQTGAASDEPLNLAKLRLFWLLAALALAAGYAAALALKWSFSRKAAQQKGLEVRALTPIPVALRAALSGMALGGALLLAVGAEYPTLAGVLLVVSIVFASELPPRVVPSLRGPGHWVRFDDHAPEARTLKHSARLFDMGSMLGFVAFALCLSAFVAVAAWLFPKAPYHGLLALLGAACLLPLFGTGKISELPPDPVERPRRFFASLARRLQNEKGLSISFLARTPEGRKQADEVRLLVEADRMPDGFLAMELGLEYQVGPGAVVDLPCVMLRALDDSAAYYSMPRNVVWSRGRNNSERVTLLRPKLPTRAACSELVLEVVGILQAAARRGRGQVSAPRQRNMSPGKPLVTSKSRIEAPAQRI